MKKIISRIILCVIVMSIVFSIPLVTGNAYTGDKETTIATTEVKTTETTTEVTTELTTEETTKVEQTSTTKVSTTRKEVTTKEVTSKKQENTTKSAPTTENTTENNGEWIKFTATAYCGGSCCCGQWAGSPTASGAYPRANHTIAVDPNVIPMGTTVEIEGMGTYVAEDTGSAIKGNKIDIYFDSHSAANNFGRRTIYVKW